MTGVTTTRAKHFQPIINFLTETIDRSFSKEEKIRQAIAANHVEDHGQLKEIQERRDAAYRTLERVLELVLQDIRSKTADQLRADVQTRPGIFSPDFMDRVFPEDQAGEDLRQRFVRMKELS